VLNASRNAFVGAVRPSVAVVSVGAANQFGHPVAGVVQRYAQAGEIFAGRSGWGG
jgi:beta-lactamase superfamily II metal-dependent hydrolase